jgi:hypothetical protein
MEQSNHGGGGDDGDGGKEQEKRRRQVLDYVEDLQDDEEDFLEDDSPADAAGGSSSLLQMEDSSDAMRLAKSSERNSAANAMLDSLDAGTFDEEPKVVVYDDQKKAAASHNVVSLTTFTTESTNNNTLNKQQRGDDGPNKTSLQRQNPITVTGALRVYGDSPPIQQPLQEDRHSDDNGRLRDQEGIQDTPFAVQATLVEEDDANNNSEHSPDLEAAVAVSNKTGLSLATIVKAEPIKNNTKTSWKLWAIIALLMAIVLGMAIGIPLTRDREEDRPRKGSSDD